MRTQECLDLLAALTGSAGMTVPEGSPLHRDAEAVLVMARAYESDGRRFLLSGDPVNALASAWYGFGWFHFGIAYGLLETGLPAGCPFLSRCEHVLPEHAGKLNEKAGRYRRLLDTARSSVACTGEPSTGSRRFGKRVLCIAGAYAAQGSVYLRDGAGEDALACFSYGHGWLDAGVTAGLFAITAHNEIFTV